ncbi:MAG: hypothetical protein ACLGH3_08045 [Actinomycetota bacterium]
MSRLVATLSTIAVLFTGCSIGPTEPPPAALSRFLEALKDGRYATAYSLTSLEELSDSFGRGAAITREHFIAAWEADPLERYEVGTVTRIDRRTIDAPRETGTPFFEVDLRFDRGDGPEDAVVTVDGEISGVVNLDVYGLRLEGVPEITTSLEVDGVRTPIRRRDGIVPLLLLGGRHQVRIADKQIDLRADEPEVIAGPAELTDPATATIRLLVEGV